MMDMLEGMDVQRINCKRKLRLARIAREELSKKQHSVSTYHTKPDMEVRYI